MKDMQTKVVAAPEVTTPVVPVVAPTVAPVENNDHPAVAQDAPALKPVQALKAKLIEGKVIGWTVLGKGSVAGRRTVLAGKNGTVEINADDAAAATIITAHVEAYGGKKMWEVWMVKTAVEGQPVTLRMRRGEADYRRGMEVVAEVALSKDQKFINFRVRNN